MCIELINAQKYRLIGVLAVGRQVMPRHWVFSIPTAYITDMLQCPCGLQYVARTKCPLQVRLNKHISNIRSGYTKHSVSRHNCTVIWTNRILGNTIFISAYLGLCFHPNYFHLHCVYAFCYISSVNLFTVPLCIFYFIIWAQYSHFSASSFPLYVFWLLYNICESQLLIF